MQGSRMISGDFDLSWLDISPRLPATYCTSGNWGSYMTQTTFECNKKGHVKHQCSPAEYPPERHQSATME
ncbi:hypothetical protein WG66_014881 [Moniliophthora roreri]|nr:hypothetical protein WG66_014881 [Moniliophthora roreri]